MQDSSAIWKTNPDNSWRLYTNTEYQTPEVKESTSKTDANQALHAAALGKQSSPTQSQQTKLAAATPFSFTKVKPMTKGSTICTSKGYGIIQAFHEDKSTISVKIEGQVHELPQDEVLSDIPLSVVFMDNTMKREEVIYLPITSTMNDLVERAENSFSGEDDLSSVKLYLKGKEVSESTETLEKLKILPWTKFLGISKPKKALCVNRYAMMHPGWGVGMGTPITLCFSASKTIRVLGFGMYKPTQGTLKGAAKLFRGSRISTGEALYSEQVTITMSEPKDIVEILFKKPCLLKAGESCSVVFMPMDLVGPCTTHYGTGGMTSSQGEGGVTFTFRLCEDSPFGGNLENGLLPTIYYY